MTRPLPEIETMYTAVLGPDVEYALPGCVIRVLPIGRGIGFWLTDKATGSDVDFLWRWSDCCYVHEQVFMQRWPEMKPRYSAVPNRRLDALLKRYGREPSGSSAPSSPAGP